MKKLLIEWRKFLKEGESEFADLLSQVAVGEYELNGRNVLVINSKD